jgi:diguanylate cyclase (GGDEF)-like protein
MLSLKWKALIGLTLLLFFVNCGLGYLGYLSLERQLQTQLELMTRRFASNFNHMLESNKRLLKNIGDSAYPLNPAADPYENDTYLKNFLDSNWNSLQSKWELESAILFDERSERVGAWGKAIAIDAARALAAAATVKSLPISDFHCANAGFENACALMTAVPLDSSDARRRTLVMSMPIADLIIDLARDNFLNTAVLIPRGMADSQLTIDKWNLTLVASSDLATTFDLLQTASSTLRLTELVEAGAQIKSNDGHYFYIRAIAADQVNKTSDVMMILIDDITAQHEALRTRIVQAIIAAALGMLISEIALLAILWQPMERIKWQSKVLPLLADGDYHSVYSWPGNRNIKYRDELDILEDSSIVLGQRLEKMSLEIRRRARELEYIASNDVLTGLANRRSFENSLLDAIADHARAQRSFAVLFIDMDNFKKINDSLGHNIGDDLLIEISRRLKSVMRVSDTVARLGGDEFIVLLRNMENVDTVVKVINKIQQALHEPLILGTRQMSVTGSIGVALAPENGLDPSTLMKNADMAMYRAKAQGRNTYEFFTDVISDSATRLLDMEIELTNALERRQFILFYQPIVSFPHRQVVGLEALVRWKHPTKGLVGPDEFIPLMESNGMVTELDRQVIAMACRDLQVIQHEAGENVTLSVNLSAHQLRDAALVEFLQTQIELADINPKYLKLEVTESALMEDVDHAVVVLTQLKALGVKLSIDDFGTGYSSLNYLKKLPVDELKVDRSFVSDIPDDAPGMEIVAAVIAMAHKLKLAVVAEGIENEQQIEFLLGCQCDYGQGYFFQRPAARASTIAWLQRIFAENIHGVKKLAGRA